MILALDAGRDRVGMAVLAPDGSVTDKRRIALRELEVQIRRVLDRYAVREVVIGAGTGSEAVRSITERITEDYGLAVHTVNEEESTIRGRKLFVGSSPWLIRPFRFLQVLFGRPVDEWAAVVIGRRHLGGGSPQS